MLSDKVKYTMIDLEKIAQKEKLKSLGIVGSRARGDSNKFSDYDLIGISDEVNFKRFNIGKDIFELHVTKSILDWQHKPSWWYTLEYVEVVIDDGSIERLPELIDLWQSNYSPSKKDIQNNYNWLVSVEQKIKGANNKTKLTFILTTSLWEILSGVFISKRKPVPANSDMFRLAPSVIGVDNFNKLICGSLEDKKNVSLNLISNVKIAHNQTINWTP